MPTSTSSKSHSHAPAAAPAPVAAFGVTINAPTASKAAAGEMDPKKKKLILVGVLVAASAVVLYFQYRPTTELDAEAQANPQVAEVVKLESKGDTAALAQLTRSDDPMVARRAVSALANKGAFEQFREALGDRRAEVRYAAVSTKIDKIIALDYYTGSARPGSTKGMIFDKSGIPTFARHNKRVNILFNDQSVRLTNWKDIDFINNFRTIARYWDVPVGQ